MESLGDILKRIQANQTRRSLSRQSGNESPPSPPPSEPALESCNRCHGVGWLSYKVSPREFDYRRCACQVKPELEDRHREVYAELPNPGSPKTFATFRESSRNKQAVCSALAFVHRQERSHVLTLYGPNGSGKSHLLEAIGREMLAQKRWVKYAYAPDLLDALRGSYSPEAEEGFTRVYERYSRSEVLLLDDLGAERTSEWAVEKLTRLVDERYRLGKLMVVATNLDEESMAQKFAPRMADRLFDSLTGVVTVEYINDDSHRTGRRWRMPWAAHR